MRKTIYSQKLDGYSEVEFTGPYGENGKKIYVNLSYDENGVFMWVGTSAEDEYDDEREFDCGISEEELENTCSMHNNCWDCPLNEYCGEECE